MVVDHDDVAEIGQLRPRLEHRREVGGVFDDRDSSAAVARDERDLLRRRRVVDRDGSRTGEHHPDVGGVELRSVAHHQHDAIAVADTEIAEGAGEAGRTICVPGPGPLPPRRAVEPPQRDCVGTGPDLIPERERHRSTGRLLAQFCARDSHDPPVCESTPMLSTGVVGKPGDNAPQCRRHASRGGRWGPGRPGRRALYTRSSSGRVASRWSSSARTASVSAPSGRPG